MIIMLQWRNHQNIIRELIALPIWRGSVILDLCLLTTALHLSFSLPFYGKRACDITSEAVHNQRRNHDPEPIRDDPIDNRVRHSVMTHSAVVTKVLLSPVENGLAKSHRRCCETPKRGRRGANDACEVDGVHIHEGFDDVEWCWQR